MKGRRGEVRPRGRGARPLRTVVFAGLGIFAAGEIFCRALYPAPRPLDPGDR